MSSKGIVILGIGNVLQKDDGIGIKILNFLESQYLFPENVELVDGGTTGAGLDRSIVNKEWVIVIDALDVKGSPGEVRVLSEEEFINRPGTTKMSPHQVGFLDLIQLMKIEGTGPERVDLIGIIPEYTDNGVEISEKVDQALDKAVSELLKMLQAKDILPTKRDPTLKPDYWWT
jgi:hydrogenase maturation protease